MSIVRDYRQVDVVLYTSPEFESRMICNTDAKLQLESLLKEAREVQMNIATAYQILSTPNIPLDYRCQLEESITESRAHKLYLLRSDNVRIEYKQRHEKEELAGYKVTSTFKYVEIIHGVTGSKAEAERMKIRVENNMKRRISQQHRYVLFGRKGFTETVGINQAGNDYSQVKRTNDTLYWLERQYKDGVKITPVTMREE